MAEEAATGSRPFPLAPRGQDGVEEGSAGPPAAVVPDVAAPAEGRESSALGQRHSIAATDSAT